MPVLEERYQRLLQLFTDNKVKDVDAFVQGRLPDMETDAAVVHAAVNLLKDENINIARRTVVKYRERLGILSSNKRRQF